MNKVKIINLATSDEAGAGIASRNFNNMFLKSGHKSVLIVKESRLRNENVIVLHDINDKSILRSSAFKVKKYFSRFQNKLQRIVIGALKKKFSFYNLGEEKQYITAKRLVKKFPYSPDVIILHWVTNFISSKTIRDLHKLTGAKIYWIMMDNAPITGGCHYPWDCEGYMKDCSNCPAIISASKKEVAIKNLALKIENMPEGIELIACSDVDMKRASNSRLFRKEKVHKIFFPIDEDLYRPSTKSIAKNIFEIEANKKVIFYGSPSLRDYRKGGNYFIKTLGILQNLLLEEGYDLGEFVVLVAGNSNIDSFNNVGFNIKVLGHLNEEALIKAYQAADVYVSTSLEDSGPLMINQAIMCGTPVVAFNVGVARDLVKSGETGYLANLYDCEGLAFGIKYITTLTSENYCSVEKACRDTAIKEYSIKKTSAKWELLIQQK